MGRWADGQMGRWADGQTGRRADGQTGRRAGGQEGRRCRLRPAGRLRGPSARNVGHLPGPGGFTESCGSAFQRVRAAAPPRRAQGQTGKRESVAHLRFLTAGESHGKALVVIVEGLPAGLPVSAESVGRELARRMQGYGRGARMKIEQDAIEWLAGVRAGETLGSPVAMLIPNRDWANWEDVMAPEGAGETRRRRVTRPRPGHADLVGVLKYDRGDARDILERASARETAVRVAAGALARRLLEEFGVEIGSHLVALGGVRATPPDPLPTPLNAASDRSVVRTLDAGAEAAMIRRIDEAKAAGDTLGGEVEVVARGVVLGLGSHTHWDRKLDGRLAAMLMSIPAVKGVEVGLGFEAARRPGSAVHDPIAADATGPLDPRGGFRRLSNNAGGLEGGMTTGEPLVVRVAMKPISTLMSPLRTVDLTTGREAAAQSERSDVTAVPAMGVIAEALVALVLADAMLEKFGGDSLAELRRNVEGYVAALDRRWRELEDSADRDA
jgi:chorismate synthase